MGFSRIALVVCVPFGTVVLVSTLPCLANDCGFGRAPGLARDGFVYGHELRAVEQAGHGGEIGVLSSNQYLSRKIVVLERLDGAARSTVIRGQDCGQRSFQIVQGLRHQNVGLGRTPLGHPNVGKDLDVAAVDQGLQHFHLSGTHDLRVWIERRTAQKNVIPFGRVLG